MGLTRNTALITGASSGIGAATAARLAAAGYRLVLVGRDETRLAEVAARTGGEILPADLATAADLERVSTAARDVHILINNAGLGWAGEVAAMDAADIAELVAVNLTAPLRLAHAALPSMMRREAGHLVFISSVAVVGVHREAVYAATKAALRTFADSVRYEADGVRVTTVLPGAVRTPFFQRRGEPYQRTVPREVSPARVARELVRAMESGAPEVFVPRWLSVAARTQGAMPRVFHLLARRFG